MLNIQGGITMRKIIFNKKFLAVVGICLSVAGGFAIKQKKLMMRQHTMHLERSHQRAERTMLSL